MSRDTAHTLIGLLSLIAISGGSFWAWGPGYSLMLVGGIMLTGLIYARTR